jgi:hypothetical protein
VSAAVVIRTGLDGLVLTHAYLYIQAYATKGPMLVLRAQKSRWAALARSFRR